MVLQVFLRASSYIRLHSLRFIFVVFANGIFNSRKMWNWSCPHMFGYLTEIGYLNRMTHIYTILHGRKNVLPFIHSRSFFNLVQRLSALTYTAYCMPLMTRNTLLTYLCDFYLYNFRFLLFFSFSFCFVLFVWVWFFETLWKLWWLQLIVLLLVWIDVNWMNWTVNIVEAKRQINRNS